MVRCDALAVVVRLAPGVRVIATHGLEPTSEWLHPNAAAVVRRALDEKVAAGGSLTGIALPDGRAVSSIVVVAISSRGAGDREGHALVALRVHPPFTPADAGPMTRAAELVAAELSRPAALVVKSGDRNKERGAEIATAVLLVAEALVLIAAVAAGVGTITGLLLAGPIAGVAGGVARAGRTALRLALVLSVLSFLDRATAQLLYGERGDLAFALEAGGAVLALLALAVAARAVFGRR